MHCPIKLWRLSGNMIHSPELHLPGRTRSGLALELFPGSAGPGAGDDPGRDGPPPYSRRRCDVIGRDPAPLGERRLRTRASPSPTARVDRSPLTLNVNVNVNLDVQTSHLHVP